MNRPRRIAAALATLTMLVGACTVPTSGEATVIAQEDLPVLLRDEPAVTTTTQDTSNPTVAVYYVRARAGEDLVLELVRKPATVANRREALLALLANPVTVEEREAGLNNRLGGIELPASTDGEGELLKIVRTGVVDENGLKIREIELNGPIDLDGSLLRQAYAQLVFTVTEGATVDFVRFIIAGQVVDISLGNDLKQLVTPADFADLAPITE